MRGHLGYEIGQDALKEGLRRGGKPSDLIELAPPLPQPNSPSYRHFRYSRDSWRFMQSPATAASPSDQFSAITGRCERGARWG